MVQSELPLRASVLVSRPLLDRLADKALADPANAHHLAGRWAGLYHVAGVEVLGNTVVLYLGEDKGSYGLLRVPGATTDAINDPPDLLPFPDFPKGAGAEGPSGKRASGDWFVMYSWYWLVKVGWS
jgi:hypothetical protein